MRKDVRLLSEEANNEVVQLPGRKFPGLVVQGDTMASWQSLAQEAIETIRTGDSENALAAVTFLQEVLKNRLLHYEKTLAAHNLTLPYVKEPEHKGL